MARRLNGLNPRNAIDFRETGPLLEELHFARLVDGGFAGNR